MKLIVGTRVSFSPATADGVQHVYLLLLILHTLAASFIWGINTLFLLDAGLSNAQAFGANAFFTAGMMVFEVPTGVPWPTVVIPARDAHADRLDDGLPCDVVRLCALLGVGARLSVARPRLTFFSGAVQAWLTDALTSTGSFANGGQLETVLAKGEIVEGAAMLGGSVAGGLVAQATSLGVPYLLRTVS